MKTIYRLGYFDKIKLERCVVCFDTLNEVIEKMQAICDDIAFLFEFVEVVQLQEEL